jgi:hypothetical protein
VCASCFKKFNLKKISDTVFDDTVSDMVSRRAGDYFIVVPVAVFVKCAHNCDRAASVVELCAGLVKSIFKIFFFVMNVLYPACLTAELVYPSDLHFGRFDVSHAFRPFLL